MAARRALFARPDRPDRPVRLTLLTLTVFALSVLAANTKATEAAASANSSNPSADAVRAAQSTALPDYKGMISDAQKNPGDTLGGFGSGDLSLVESERDLYRDGAGELYGPAVTTVAGCRNQEDPECRAIQILDRGFPERPPIPDDMLAGRDEVIDGIGIGTPPDNMGGIGTDGVCSDFTITTKPIYAEEVCRPGGWYDEATCNTGWEDGPAQILTRWRCTKEKAVAEALACRIPVDFTTTTETTQRCWFGSATLADLVTVVEETTATASAVFPAVCEAPQFADEVFTCDANLIVQMGDTCKIGDVASVRVQGSPSMAEDGCPGGSWLEVRHACVVTESTLPSTHRYEVELAGYPAKKIVPNGRIEMPDPANSRCKAILTVGVVSCTGVNCIAPVKADVYHDKILTGRAEAKFPYKAYDRFASMNSHWEDGCEIFDEAENGTVDISDADYAKAQSRTKARENPAAQTTELKGVAP